MIQSSSSIFCDLSLTILAMIEITFLTIIISDSIERLLLVMILTQTIVIFDKFLALRLL